MPAAQDALSEPGPWAVVPSAVVTSRRTAALGWAALLAVLCVLAPLTGQPLYDGVGVPGEPYRWVVAPVGAPSAPPAAGAEQQVALAGGRNGSPVTVLTVEQGPQALVVLEPGAVRSASDRVVVRLEPGVPPRDVPGVAAASNAYALVLEAADGSRVRLSGAPLVQLRVPSDVRPPVALLLERDGRWEALRTRRTGADVYSAALPVAGRVVAVRVLDAALLERHRTSRWSAQTLLLPAVLAVVLVAAVVSLRRRRAGDRAHASNPSA